MTEKAFEVLHQLLKLFSVSTINSHLLSTVVNKQMTIIFYFGNNFHLNLLILIFIANIQTFLSEVSFFRFLSRIKTVSN